MASAMEMLRTYRDHQDRRLAEAGIIEGKLAE